MKYLMKAVIFMICISAFSIRAGALTQLVRGQVMDQETRTPLYGANVMIAGTNLGGSTDENGWFRISGVPLGRYDIQVFYMGYEQMTIPEIPVHSGKEVVLNVEMRESVIYTQALTVMPSIDKEKPLNAMATTSARTFSVEETRRYAGGLDDPARMASGFAGVTTGQVQDNAIIIRGNAPNGILWRLEGIEIPNPNHFADGNYDGGGLVTLFSSQLLDNSDFMTGAFPGEYGNALSGVFDMNLRNGNNEQHEYAFQAGILGIDVAAEGPFQKGSPGSYLFNYRYSTTALLTPILNTEQIPKYQDLSFKLNFPTRQAGTFSLWGIGGVDTNLEYASDDPDDWTIDWERIGYEWKARVGAAGLTHKITTGDNTYISTTLASTANKVSFHQERYDDRLELQKVQWIDSETGKHTLSAFVNHKFNARYANKTGVAVNYLFYDQNFRAALDNVPPMRSYIRESGGDLHTQTYSQSSLRITQDLTLNPGLHFEFFHLNRHFSVEPRIGLQYAFKPGQSLSLAYGMHSQLPDIRVYLTRGENGIPVNRDLDFMKAHHVVLAYDRSLTENVRLKIEPYFQALSDVPVVRDSSYSFANFKSQWFFDHPLVNGGTGRNAGIDITLERFLNNNYYYLLTASVFSSKYTGGDGVERNTRYARNLVLNALFGREFHIGRNNVLGLNGRFTAMGGERRSPVHLPLTQARQEIVYDETRAFEMQNPTSYVLDLTLTWRINRKSVSHVWALQVKNALGARSINEPSYNCLTNMVEKDYDTIVLPSLSYKVEF
ncbi:TonB-dependent receptor [bacterium]|nr:TonB-dependent receptor [bacterium]